MDYSLNISNSVILNFAYFIKLDKRWALQHEEIYQYHGYTKNKNRDYKRSARGDEMVVRVVSIIHWAYSKTDCSKKVLGGWYCPFSVNTGG